MPLGCNCCLSVVSLCVHSPLKLLNRHNEVWYVAEGQTVCTDPQEPTPAHTPRPPVTNSPTDSLSEPLPNTLFDSPLLTPSNLSSNTTANSSSHASSETPAGLPSNATPSPSSKIPADVAFSYPPTSTQTLLDPTSNLSNSVSVSPSQEPKSDAALWTHTDHSPLDTLADSNPVVEPDDSH